MSERSNEHDWKSCDVKASAGSNPVLCARKNDTPFSYRSFRYKTALVRFTGGHFFIPTSPFGSQGTL